MQLLRLVDKERAQMGLLKTPQQDAAIVSLFEVLERQRLGDGGANMVALLGGAGVGKSTVLRLLSTAMSGMTVASESDGELCNAVRSGTVYVCLSQHHSICRHSLLYPFYLPSL